MDTHIEHVQRRYEQHEMLDFGKEQAKLVEDILRLKDEKKSAMDHFKDEVSQRETRLKEVSTNVNRGYEIIPTPCDVVLNTPTRGMKSFVCRKTLNVIRTVPMDDRDRQSGLFGNETGEAI